MTTDIDNRSFIIEFLFEEIQIYYRFALLMTEYHNFGIVIPIIL
nr:MAG TPA: hypothetical protein [Caudoviricetes sp.]